MIWVVCGAGRKVGKTTVAQAIDRLLDSSVYCKCGHRDRKDGKPENFFTTVESLQEFIGTAKERFEHIVVESNSLMYITDADVSIYIDGVEGITDFRGDAIKLCQKADIRICRDSLPAEWQQQLVKVVSDAGIIARLCEIFLNQYRHLFSLRPNVRSKVWFETGQSRVFGAGLAMLLENVEKTGTLQSAAACSSMSYRHAWDMIKVAETNLGLSLIKRQTGGVGGGRSRLTGQGRRMLKSFKILNEDVAQYADNRFRQLMKKEKANG